MSRWSYDSHGCRTVVVWFSQVSYDRRMVVVWLSRYSHDRHGCLIYLSHGRHVVSPMCIATIRVVRGLCTLRDDIITIVDCGMRESLHFSPCLIGTGAPVATDNYRIRKSSSSG